MRWCRMVMVCVGVGSEGFLLWFYVIWIGIWFSVCRSLINFFFVFCSNMLKFDLGSSDWVLFLEGGGEWEREWDEISWMLWVNEVCWWYMGFEKIDCRWWFCNIWEFDLVFCDYWINFWFVGWWVGFLGWWEMSLGFEFVRMLWFVWRLCSGGGGWGRWGRIEELEEGEVGCVLGVLSWRKEV